MPSRESPASALAKACAELNLPGAAGAEILYKRSNAVYKLAGQLVVARLRYAPDSATWMNRLSVSIQVTRWLYNQGFPTVQPLELTQQPVAAAGYLVTFWHYLPAVTPPGEDADALARLLRHLHSLPQPPVTLPPARPLSSLPEDAKRCSWLTATQRSWILDRIEELQAQYANATWPLGCGMIHADAYPQNLIHTRNHVVLCDWDSVSYGPREQDIAPASIRHRFGRPESEWCRFCSSYGVNPDDLPGLAVLREMREIRTLGPYLRTSGEPQVRAEVSHRITDLMSGTQREPWRALNLASDHHEA